jgi:hypothetical protein
MALILDRTQLGLNTHRLHGLPFRIQHARHFRIGDTDRRRFGLNPRGCRIHLHGSLDYILDALGAVGRNRLLKP